MKVLLLEEARRRFEAEDTWWREHRDHADLFTDEFERSLAHLAGAPESGSRYRFVRGRMVWRWLMKKTWCHIYYAYDEKTDTLEVHTIWGARRGDEPKF